MNEHGFDEARLWETLGGIRADVSTIKSNQSTLFSKVDTLATNGCAIGTNQSKELQRHAERLVAIEQGSRVDEQGNMIMGDSISARVSRKHVMVAAGAGAGAGGAFLLLQMLLDFFLKIHAK